MKRKRFLWGCVLFMVLAITACAPATPENVVPTQPPATVVADTESPTATEPPTDTPPPATDAPALVPVTGPVMETGSTYPYVDGSTLIAVPAGEFMMGGDRRDNPEHPVTLSDFWIYSTKVTNQQYALCVSLGACTPPAPGHNLRYNDIEHANDPAVGVNFEQAAAYCSFVHARLPTEAEWEKVARGPDGNTYPWGEEKPTCDLLNYYSCVGGTSSVMNYPQGASYYGALDMAGNAYEWVADWYDSNYYENSPQQDPPGPEDGTKRSVRSSGYKTDARDTVVALRHSYDPQEQHSDLGFRCAVDQPGYFATFCELPPVFPQTGASASSETCPVVGIEQSQACAKKLSTTNIVFKGPDDATVDLGGCAPTGDPRVFNCLGAGQISISASCDVNITGEPDCGPGYSLKGSVCQANSTQGACLAGMNFDSAQGCCTVETQPQAASVLPVCPVGTYHVAGQEACTPAPLHGVVSEVQSIELKSCSGGGAAVPGATACEEPPGACQRTPFKWSTQFCCCYDTYNGRCY